MISECIHTDGIERAAEVDSHPNDGIHCTFYARRMTPHVTGDAIGTYLKLAPEAANQHDSFGMNPFQYLCRSVVTFLGNFSALMYH